MTDRTTITPHTQEYFRVVLEGIDRQIETPDSFSIKLSMRLRLTPQRVRQVMRNLPYTVKAGLNSGQANTLKGLLEEIGGVVRLETYFVEPGQRNVDSRTNSERDYASRDGYSRGGQSGGSAGATDLAHGNGTSDPRAAETPVQQKQDAQDVFGCPKCGWEESLDATYCSMCYRRFRDPDRRAKSLSERSPSHNPLQSDNDPMPVVGMVVPKWVFVGAGAVVLLALLLLIK